VEAGHAAHLISEELGSTIRQNQKTDKRDVLAIVQASLFSDISFIQGKTVSSKRYYETTFRLKIKEPEFATQSKLVHKYVSISSHQAFLLLTHGEST